MPLPLELKNEIEAPKQQGQYVALVESTLYVTIIDHGLNDDDAGELVRLLQDSTYHIDLNLEHNNIGNKGAKSIATLKKIKKLNLKQNKIYDDGAIALANNSAIKWLNLHTNGLTDKCLPSLARFEEDCLDIRGNPHITKYKESPALVSISELKRKEVAQQNLDSFFAEDQSFSPELLAPSKGALKSTASKTVQITVEAKQTEVSTGSNFSGVKSKGIGPFFASSTDSESEYHQLVEMIISNQKALLIIQNHPEYLDRLKSDESIMGKGREPNAQSAQYS